jgi:ATP-dependent Clp protease protease subunit
MKLVRENVDRFFDYDVHLETRTIYIGDAADGEVGPLLSEMVIKGIHLLSNHKEEPIKIILNSLGGCWYSGMAIYDAIKACPCHVTIEVMGAAMSMGSIILQAADERIAHPSSTIMIHDGSDFFDGHARNFERWGDYSKVIRKKMYEIYAEKSGKPVSYWEKRCAHDFILTAQGAKEEKLIDKIYGEDQEKA